MRGQTRSLDMATSWFNSEITTKKLVLRGDINEFCFSKWLPVWWFIMWRLLVALIVISTNVFSLIWFPFSNYLITITQWSFILSSLYFGTSTLVSINQYYKQISTRRSNSYNTEDLEDIEMTPRSGVGQASGVVHGSVYENALTFTDLQVEDESSAASSSAIGTGSVLQEITGNDALTIENCTAITTEHVPNVNTNDRREPFNNISTTINSSHELLTNTPVIITTTNMFSTMNMTDSPSIRFKDPLDENKNSRVPFDDVSRTLETRHKSPLETKEKASNELLDHQTRECTPSETDQGNPLYTSLDKIQNKNESADNSLVYESAINDQGHDEDDRIETKDDRSHIYTSLIEIQNNCENDKSLHHRSVINDQGHVLEYDDVDTIQSKDDRSHVYMSLDGIQNNDDNASKSLACVPAESTVTDNVLSIKSSSFVRLRMKNSAGVQLVEVPDISTDDFLRDQTKEHLILEREYSALNDDLKQKIDENYHVYTLLIKKPNNLENPQTILNCDYVITPARAEDVKDKHADTEQGKRMNEQAKKPSLPFVHGDQQRRRTERSISAIEEENSTSFSVGYSESTSKTLNIAEHTSNVDNQSSRREPTEVQRNNLTTSVAQSPNETLPLSVKIMWILYNINSAVSLSVVLISYMVFRGYDKEFMEDAFFLITLHLNSYFALIENFLCSIPCHFVNFYQPWLFGVIHFFFILICWSYGVRDMREMHIMSSYFDYQDTIQEMIMISLLRIFLFIFCFGVHHIIYVLRCKSLKRFGPSNNSRIS